MIIEIGHKRVNIFRNIVNRINELEGYRESVQIEIESAPENPNNNQLIYRDAMYRNEIDFLKQLLTIYK